MTKLPKSIFDLIDLEAFRIRPGMYLQVKSIDVLRAFIDGYQYALDRYEVTDDKNERFKNFRDWVLEHYSKTQYTGGWNHIILENCKGDQEKSVDKFFELYDKFKMDQNALQHKK